MHIHVALLTLLLAAVAGCHSDSTTVTNADAPQAEGGVDGGHVDAASPTADSSTAATCAIPAVTDAPSVVPTFTFYDPPTTSPTTMTGGTLSGTYRVSKAVVYLPKSTKGVANAATSTGTVKGWATFENGQCRLAIDASLSVASQAGAQAETFTASSQGSFTAAGSALTFGGECGSTGDVGVYTFTSGTPAKLVIKTSTTFGDSYLELDATKQ
jgi:hypothetical protein